MQLRGYQKRIVSQVGTHNAIVLLPTGSGKTLIASEIVKRILNLNNSRKALFLVPTCTLVEQQAKAIRQWTAPALKVGEYMGGAAMPRAFNVLVSTPQAFLSAQTSTSSRRHSVQWSSFALVVFDEVHHVLKQHPYRKIAKSLRKCNSNGNTKIQIIGLTASLTYAVTSKQVTNTIARLSVELNIEMMATASTEELTADGYHGNVSVAEKRITNTNTNTNPSGSAYSASNSASNSAAKKVIPINERKPHLMYKLFCARSQQRRLMPFAESMMDIIHALETTAKRLHPSFVSPLRKNKLSSWAIYAHSLRLFVLEDWYDALRLIVMHWEDPEGLELAVHYLQMKRRFERNSAAATAMPLIASFFARFGNLSAAKFQDLKQILLAKSANSNGNSNANSSENSKLRAIIFVQQKIVVHIVTHFIANDADLRTIGIRAVPLYSSTTGPATPTLSLSKSEARLNLQAFADGTANVLVCTTVAEEGIDVPSANCVIRFDAILNSVSFVQGRGRARQANSSFVVMSERKNRSVEELNAIEQLQSNIVSQFSEMRIDSAELARQEKVKQANRERNAAKVLQEWRLPSNAMSALNLYCNKTKVALGADFTRTQSGQFVCRLHYESCLRNISAEGIASGKKNAKRAAAAKLLSQLR